MKRDQYDVLLVAMLTLFTVILCLSVKQLIIQTSKNIIQAIYWICVIILIVNEIVIAVLILMVPFEEGKYLETTCNCC